jgi:hypothetical protein
MGVAGTSGMSAATDASPALHPKLAMLCVLSDNSLKILKSWKIFIEGVSFPGSVDWESGSQLLAHARERRAEFAELAKVESVKDMEQSAQNWTIGTNNFMCDGVDIGCPFMYQLYNSEVRLVSPVMTEKGAINQYYSHVMPALFLNQLLPTLISHENNLVETYVICLGNRCAYPWWDREIPVAKFHDVAVYIARLIISTSAFQHAIKRLVRAFGGSCKKTIRRLCIWLKVWRHVFMLVLEATQETVVCFSVNNIVRDEFTDAIVNAFVIEVNENKFFKSMSARRFPAGAPVISAEQISISPDMMCVSFMARCTLYLSMVNSSYQRLMVGSFAKATGPLVESAAYDEFESGLFKFIEDTHREGKLVWLSPMNRAFMNINDIYLMKVEKENAGSREGRKCFVYAGSGEFVERIPRPIEESRPLGGCGVSSHFTPSQCLLRECSAILERLRLKTN